MINVEINIESVFAQFENVNELKEVAQSVVNQVNSAYKARLAELQGKTKENAPVMVAISTSSKGDKATNKTTKGATKAKEPAKKTTKPQTKAISKTEKQPKEEIEQVSISSLTKAQIKAMDIKFVKYSDKSMFLSGNTRCIKDEIMATGGAHWNGNRQGWFLKNDTAKALAKALKIKTV